MRLEYNDKPVAVGDSVSMETDKLVRSYIVQAFTAGGKEGNILRMLRMRYIVAGKREQR